MHTTRGILKALTSGKLTIDEAEKKLQILTLSHVEGFAVLDHGRQDRTGIPEVVMAETKQSDEIIKITRNMLDVNGFALLTRANQKKVDALESAIDNYVINVSGSGDHLTVFVHSQNWKPPEALGRIAVITAGTSDIPYAREVEAVAKVVGVETISFFDVGVAGIHRLIDPLKQIVEKDVDVIVVLAGMEGALPTVIASLVDIPVIGVPIPTGYGYGGEGITALSSMLQSCAPGLAVVNIGNGLGAGAIAALIARRRVKPD
ncbi:MAG: nickel pincer cofactor biosynthesis protein LarB [Candidatus Thorarchaeota archaeon]|nr:nickel pincer cofactor biosynthesis protein LarB [Candidatus Thorarchaeota archaeon]